MFWHESDHFFCQSLEERAETWPHGTVSVNKVIYTRKLCHVSCFIIFVHICAQKTLKTWPNFFYEHNNFLFMYQFLCSKSIKKVKGHFHFSDIADHPKHTEKTHVHGELCVHATTRAPLIFRLFGLDRASTVLNFGPQIFGNGFRIKEMMSFYLTQTRFFHC